VDSPKGHTSFSLDESDQESKLSVLVVGTHGWAIEQAAKSVEASGQRALRCHEPGEPAFPCNALIDGRTCPLDVGFDVAVTIRAAPSAAPAAFEFGVVCAVRAGRPLVVAGMTAQNPYGEWAARTIETGDIVGACTEVAEAAADARRRAVARHPSTEVVDLREDAG
jgi:hypothetical protein